MFGDDLFPTDGKETGSLSPEIEVGDRVKVDAKGTDEWSLYDGEEGFVDAVIEGHASISFENMDDISVPFKHLVIVKKAEQK